MSHLPGLGVILGFILVCFFFLATPVLAGDVSINEFVSNSSSGGSEWVEFYNASSSAEYLKSYYIDDDTSFDNDSGSSTKKSLTNLNVANTNYPFIVLSSAMFNNNGDSVVLFDKSGNIVDQYTYSEDFGSNVSVGRYPDQTGGFAVLSAMTQGDANEVPVPTPTLTPTSTPKPPATPTVTPNPTVTNTPAPSVTPTITPSPTEDPNPDILGESVASGSAEEANMGRGESDEASVAGRTFGRSPFIVSFLFIGVGLALLSVATAWQKTDLWKKIIDH